MVDVSPADFLKLPGDLVRVLMTIEKAGPDAACLLASCPKTSLTLGHTAGRYCYRQKTLATSSASAYPSRRVRAASTTR